MVQIDIPAAFVASMFFLDLGRKTVMREVVSEVAKPPAVYYRFLFRSVFFAGAVIAPAGIYLLAGWPGWEQLYWTERVENVIFHWVNALIPAFFVGAIVFASYAGHVLGYRLLVTGKDKYLRPTYLVVLAGVVVLVLFNYPAFLLVGTYQQYHFDRDIMDVVWRNPHDFFGGWITVMLYFAVSLGYVVIRLVREARAGV